MKNIRANNVALYTFFLKEVQRPLFKEARYKYTHNTELNNDYIRFDGIKVKRDNLDPCSAQLSDFSGYSTLLTSRLSDARFLYKVSFEDLKSQSPTTFKIFGDVFVHNGPTLAEFNLIIDLKSISVTKCKKLIKDYINKVNSNLCAPKNFLASN